MQQQITTYTQQKKPAVVKSKKGKEYFYNDTKHVLSFGGGVNSAAMLLLIREQNMPLDLVMFSDTGDELPETYETVKYWQNYCAQNGIEFVTVRAKYGVSLYDYMYAKKIFASRRRRDCTTKFKIAPKRAYLRARFGKDTLFVNYIGYDAGEPHRYEKALLKGYDVLYEDCKYPLVTHGLDRQGCIDYIAKKGHPVPQKSGCFHCPFTKKCGWLQLLVMHPELYARAQSLEENSNEYQKGYYLSSRPLAQLKQHLAALSEQELEGIKAVQRITK